MLKVNDINVYYGPIHAIKGVSFEVNEGEIVALIGANGAGKSTILKTISGLLRPKTGSITFMGKDITRMEAHKIVQQGIAHCPEGRRIFLKMTVMENLELGAYSRQGRGSGRKQIQEDLDKVFSLFPKLKERQKQPAGTLSGGEQQMLAMGRALMSRPKMLLLDEPSMGLAPMIVKDVFRIIQEINRAGTTVLLVEQNAHLALNTASRAYVLETGKVVLQGGSQELLKNDQVRQAYLGE